MRQARREIGLPVVRGDAAFRGRRAPTLREIAWNGDSSTRERFSLFKRGRIAAALRKRRLQDAEANVRVSVVLDPALDSIRFYSRFANRFVSRTKAGLMSSGSRWMLSRLKVSLFCRAAFSD